MSENNDVDQVDDQARRNHMGEVVADFRELVFMNSSCLKEFVRWIAQVEERLQRTTDRAGRAYTVLALRGERLVTSIRRQPATEVAVEEGKEAVRKVEAAADAARRSVRAGEQALKNASAKLG